MLPFRSPFKLRIFTLILLAQFFGHFASAQLTEEQKQAQWQELRKYDKYASKLKNFTGSWVPLNSQVVQVLKLLSQRIKEVAKVFGVDPRAVISSILTENSINAGISDDIQDFLVKNQYTPDGTIFGKKFTFGLGQLGTDEAMQVEAAVASYENRPVKSRTEVAEALLIPEKAIVYTIAVIARIQEIYRKHGFDISKNPDLLATVYNLGQAEERATRAEQSKQQPRINFFGLFYRFHADEISSILETESDVVAANTLIGKERKSNQRLELRVAPPFCSNKKNGDAASYSKILTYDAFTVSGNLDSGVSFEVLAPGLGCDLEPWFLVRGSNGSVGWISDADLKKGSETVYTPNPACEPTPDPVCYQQVLNEKDVISLGERAENGMELRLSGMNEYVDYRRPLLGPVSPNSMTQDPESSEYILTPADSREISAAIEIKMKELLNNLNAKRQVRNQPPVSWFNDLNPYNQLFTNHKWSSLDICLKDQVNCRSTKLKKDILDFINSDFPTYPDIKTMNKMLSWDSYFSIDVEDKVSDEVVSESVQSPRERAWEIVGPCMSYFKTLPEVGTRLESILKLLENVPKDWEPEEAMFDSLEEIKNSCAAFDKAVAAANPEDLNMVSCHYYFDDNVMDIKSRELLADILTTPQDQADYFNAYLDNLESEMDIPSVEDKSTYDPFATADLIRRLLKHPCVTTVFVPDLWLIKAIGNQGGRLLYKPFMEYDRFSVLAQTSNCNGGQP